MFISSAVRSTLCGARKSEAAVMMVELHPRNCACHGGSWMSLSGQSGASCSLDGSLPRGALVVPLDQWRAMGKPHNVEEFYDFLAHVASQPAPGERRAHER